MRDRVHPRGLDLLDRPSHADRVDALRRRQRADRDRDVVAAPLGIDHVGEQERAALILGEPALELPAHQRVQLGFLVHRAVDAHQKPRGFETREMLLEIERRAAGFWRGAAVAGLSSIDDLSVIPGAARASPVIRMLPGSRGPDRAGEAGR